MTNRDIIAGMASFADRQECMWEAIATLTPQVDKLYVYINNGFDRLDNKHNVDVSNVLFINGATMFGDIGDAGKLVKATNMIAHKRDESYFFAVDDDILYPVDYASYLISKIDQYSGKYVVGLHGKIIRGRLTSFYRDRNNIKWYHHHQNQINDILVHILGTGLLAFRTDLISLDIDDITRLPRNAADIHFAIACHNRGVPMMCVEHTNEYINLSDKIDHATDTIYGKSRNNDEEHTTAVNNINWRKLI